jgi:hypothetical protein
MALGLLVANHLLNNIIFKYLIRLSYKLSYLFLKMEVVFVKQLLLRWEL